MQEVVPRIESNEERRGRSSVSPWGCMADGLGNLQLVTGITSDWGHRHGRLLGSGGE